ncbi:ABC transporter ATP-binding protein [Halococcus hamelinensis]|uniref:Dipeptide/oligopeptide/nickel ABC transporter ATP-binding protein n=1 Tax=Halococcus hamelinensis 100A6 TaxID=1132509 RepID=M0M230_9EURY|nr:oligopeptide/dipeptide ABC transporter ATP-binding protein [Halococcus hamelinensis]EMA38644.1 dipeptide/oligopeptide/nickel ABC transporter ATP-binding protein [Halococcus hamelinensis 100A6]
MTTDHLLSVRGLKKHYPITEGILRREVGRVRAVDGIDFDLDRGETLGLVGESGCGKSTAATTLLRFEEPTEGEIEFDGTDLLACDKDELKRFRRRAQMVFQDPNSSFDPRMTIGESVAEPLRVHGLPRERRRAVVRNTLERVGLDATAADRYPHEFSGGQKQRIALARALVLNPDLIVADEPVSALDVSLQAEILTLIDDIQQEFGLGILFISHDMSVIQQVCNRVAVMYLGEIVEIGSTDAVFSDPQHPYTQALLASIPNPDPRKRGRGTELAGDVPNPSNPPSGCRFHTRCPAVIQPAEYEFEQEHWRSVMTFRIRLANRQVDADSMREVLVAEGDATDVDAIPDDRVAAFIREEFSIPTPLSDPEAESVVADAIGDITAGDPDAAENTLATAFETVCEHRHPDLRDSNGTQRAACLRHDTDVSTTHTAVSSTED